MKILWEWFEGSLRKQWFLWTLFFINFLGTIYGFIWYGNQLAETPVLLRLFVPDSPTGSGLFTLVILTYILGRHIPVLEALAGVTNFKYGVWAVGVIITGWLLGNPITWVDLMLMTSHAGMAIESVLYARFFKLGWFSVGIAALWALNNDFLDYVMDIHPWLPTVLVPYTQTVGLCTVLLSLLSISLIWYLSEKPSKNKV